MCVGPLEDLADGQWWKVKRVPDATVFFEELSQ
jgi:hypothetical protein